MAKKFLICVAIILFLLYMHPSFAMQLSDKLYHKQAQFLLLEDWCCSKNFFPTESAKPRVFERYVNSMFFSELVASCLHCVYKNSTCIIDDQVVRDKAEEVSKQEFASRFLRLPKVTTDSFYRVVAGRCRSVWENYVPFEGLSFVDKK